MRTLTLGFSPCPNDTFIFGALATGKLEVPSFQLEIIHEDVETLNKLAREALLDFTKISFHAFAWVVKRYALLSSGAALGRGCGPLVVAREERNMDSLRNEAIAIPGELTTANLLLQLYGGGFPHVHPMSYETIMPRLQRGEFAAGVIIHEGRFTYHHYGLHQVLDLGAWWEETQDLPIPLGGILIRRDLGSNVAKVIGDAIRNSLNFAHQNPEEIWSYIKTHAQEMDDEVIRQHIELYVNEYAIDLGEEGRLAIKTLLELAYERDLLPPVSGSLFLAD
jgi:1,4-dihydroxy-6-naphthoate synthase